ncbi:MAG: hypothetical protein WC283_01040 [Candidatus Paceibacterota bacterium]|jgi:hypothetical protein
MTKKLSLPIILIAAFAVLTGILGLFKLDISSFSILNFIMSAVYIITGIGLLYKKFWALRFMQGLAIISILLGFIGLFLIEDLTLLLVGMFLYIMILIYLTKEKVATQFIDLNDDTGIAEIDKKELTSLIPVFRTITWLVYWCSVIFLFSMAMFYAFEWWGNWAYLLVLGLIFPIIPFSELFSSIVLFPPIFILIFWLYEGALPWWFIGLSALCIASQYILSYLTLKFFEDTGW